MNNESTEMTKEVFPGFVNPAPSRLLPPARDLRNLGQAFLAISSGSQLLGVRHPRECHPTFLNVLTLYLFERDHTADAVAAAATAARSAAQELWRTKGPGEQDTGPGDSGTRGPVDQETDGLGSRETKWGWISPSY